MGQVYRAFDAMLNRRVAIKLLRPDGVPGSNDSESGAAPSVTRVLREARMAAALDHPNVVSIFDVGEQDGNPFIVMELVNGRSLRACVGLHEIPITERVHWLLGIARGLAAAHHAGLVHRDVKPENVLVRDDGVVKVLDFGIARLERMPSQRPPSGRMPAIATAGGTVESTLAGTPAYMAPEQIRRDSVDARVDQFSWGVVAYELLTGALPWSTGADGPVSILGAVLDKEPPRLSAAKLGIAESFVDTVHRALSKSRASRFGSMDELLLASGLAYSKGDLPMPGPRPSLHPSADSSQRLNIVAADIASAPTLLATSSASSLASAAHAAVRGRETRRRKVALGVVGAVMLLVAIGVASRWLFTRHAPSAASVTTAPPVPAPLGFHPRNARRLTFDQGCEEYPSLSPDGASVAFDSSVGDDIHIVVLDVASGAQRRLTSEPGWHFAPTISPDGTRVAYLRQHGDEVGTWVVPIDGSAPARLAASGRMRPSWSPDGHGLWAGSIDRPTRLDVDTGAVSRTLDAPPGFFILRARELADGRVIGRLLDRPTKLGRGLVLYAKDSATSSPLFPDATEDSIGVVPDGSRLLIPKLLLPTSRIELWQVPLDGTPASIVPDHLVLPTKGLDFARDGSRVVWSTCSTEQDVARLEGDTSMQATALLAKTEWTDEQPAGIPGTPTKMVIVSDRASLRQLWVVDLSGKEAARRLPLADLEAASPAVSPDGKSIAFTAVGKGIYLVPIDGATPARQLTHGAEDASASFSRDGASIYFDTASTARHHALARVPLDGSAPPVALVDDAERPWASPADDRVVYLASEGEQGTPMIYDVAARKSRRVSKAFGKGSYGAPRFSPDGTRVALAVGLNDVIEVDARSGEAMRKFTSGDQITGVTYVGRDVVISREGWHGDVWLAQDPWGERIP